MPTKPLRRLDAARIAEVEAAGFTIEDLNRFTLLSLLILLRDDEPPTATLH
jgi:hypothetical protein